MAFNGSNVNMNVTFSKEELELIVEALSDRFSILNHGFHQEEWAEKRAEVLDLAEKIDPGVTLYFE